MIPQSIPWEPSSRKERLTSTCYPVIEGDEGYLLASTNYLAIPSPTNASNWVAIRYVIVLSPCTSVPAERV